MTGAQREVSGVSRQPTCGCPQHLGGTVLSSRHDFSPAFLLSSFCGLQEGEEIPHLRVAEIVE
jgi:hypothetical protein